MDIYSVTREEPVKTSTGPLTLAKLQDDVWVLDDDACVSIFDVYP